MPDWTRLVETHLDTLDIESYSRVICPGIELNLIQDATTQLGFEPTDEFVDFYRHHNGFGFTSPDLEWWVIRPIEHLNDFREGAWEWLGEGHLHLRDLFHPFIDFGNGDAMGFLSDKNGSLEEGLYFFAATQAIGCDEDEDQSEFLTLEEESIESFLRNA